MQKMYHCYQRLYFLKKKSNLKVTSMMRGVSKDISFSGGLGKKGKMF